MVGAKKYKRGTIQDSYFTEGSMADRKRGIIMEIWVPTKWEIENILQEMVNKVSVADKISDIETYLDDSLSELDYHVTNRANREKKEK